MMTKIVRDGIELILIPPLTEEQEEFLLKERGWTRRLMTREEIEKTYPGALKNWSKNG